VDPLRVSGFGGERRSIGTRELSAESEAKDVKNVTPQATRRTSTTTAATSWQDMMGLRDIVKKSEKIKIYHKVETSVPAKSAEKTAEMEKKTASLQFVHILITIPQKLQGIFRIKQRVLHTQCDFSLP